ncbi:MAG TPA: hypothetical protein VGY48_11885 [Vicinamibacterales bacterium]|nr:hypothetical protein [Vicinamibacterales bacterium]
MLLLIAIGSTLVALVMTVVAWRAVQAEHQRSSARVAALAREIHGEARGLSGAASPSAAGSRLGLALAIGGFVVASAAAAAIVFSNDGPAASARVAPRVAAANATLPLELVALGHERDGDTLTVRGVVRNPLGGAEMDRLTAVVFTFSREGGFLNSARAPVDSPALIPGGESTFVVAVPGAEHIGRYRVSFRSDDRVVSHVDKRGRP